MCMRLFKNQSAFIFKETVLIRWYQFSCMKDSFYKFLLIQHGVKYYVFNDHIILQIYKYLQDLKLNERLGRIRVLSSYPRSNTA